MEPKLRKLTAAQAFTQKMRSDGRDKSTVAGSVVADFVGDMTGQRPVQQAPAKKSNLAQARERRDRLEELHNASFEKYSQAVDEVDALETQSLQDQWNTGDDDDEVEYIEPVADDEIVERQAAYDEAELEKMDPATRAAYEIVQGAARLVEE
jgi:hypothetical protein